MVPLSQRRAGRGKRGGMGITRADPPGVFGPTPLGGAENITGRPIGQCERGHVGSPLRAPGGREAGRSALCGLEGVLVSLWGIIAVVLSFET